MNDQTGKMLIVESDDALRAALVTVLENAGYRVSTDYREGMKAVLAFAPDLVILGADPPLDCCDLLSEIKGSTHTRDIRVVMLVHGNSAERTRGLDLGADDVLSLPLDAAELLSRIRPQLRSKEGTAELSERLRLAEESHNTNRQVVSAVHEERRTFRAGATAIVFVLIIVGLISFSFYHRSHAETVRVYAAITRLQTGALSQQSLLEHSRQSLGDQETRAAISPPKDTVTLENQVATVEGRLQKLETEGEVAHTIIEADESSVCLIHVVLAFRDYDTGLKLHYAAFTSTGELEADQSNKPLVSLTGSGPEVHLDVFGTGFLASDDGQILTNHHVVEPWWQNDELKEMLDQGLEPEIAEMTAYFPGVTHGIPITTKKISSEADVAVVNGNVSGLGIRRIAMADNGSPAIDGRPVVLLGYPTGIDAILARTDAAALKAIAASSKGEPNLVMEGLASHRSIKPVVTQGHIGDVLPDKIVYDAQTTSGGSGGPLFNDQGQVIGISFAMVRDFGGSNFAVPVRFGGSLLTR
jgi:S1-C subfamily serine protease/DNA-binding NarL/FixJ family response regulator